MTHDIAERKSVPAKSQSQLDYLLLDGSGSMYDKWWDMLSAMDVYADGLRAQNVHSQMLLQVFDDHEVDSFQRNEPVEAMATFSQNPPVATWGGTPLYDAINVMGLRFKELDPPRAHALIVTDGMENGSKTTLVQAKAILDWMRAKGWQVTFIGCDWNNSAQAKALGANPASAIGVQQKLLKDAAAELARKRAKYGLYGEDMHFSEEERSQFGGYLADNTQNGK